MWLLGSWEGVSDANAANDANACSPVYDKHDNPLTSEEEEQRAIAKIKMLGNIKFIGELGKLDLIHESILHKCIKTVSLLCCWGGGRTVGGQNIVFDCCPSSPQLLEKKKRVQLKDMGEDLECLCQIMRTVGPRLDHEKAKVRLRHPIMGVLLCVGVVSGLARLSAATFKLPPLPLVSSL